MSRVQQIDDWLRRRRLVSQPSLELRDACAEPRPLTQTQYATLDRARAAAAASAECTAARAAAATRAAQIAARATGRATRATAGRAAIGQVAASARAAHAICSRAAASAYRAASTRTACASAARFLGCATPDQSAALVNHHMIPNRVCGGRSVVGIVVCLYLVGRAVTVWLQIPTHRTSCAFLDAQRAA